MSDEKIPKAVTPIKHSMKHQKEHGARKVNLEERPLKPYDIVFNGREVTLYWDEVTGDVIIDGKLYRVELEEEEGHYIATVEKNHAYKIEYHSGQIYLEGRLVEFNFQPSIPKLERKKTSKSGTDIIKAPLPGTITEIAVKVGDEVSSGQKILTLEAMKMQNDILTDIGGKVTEILVKVGDQVSTDQRLIVIRSV